MKHERLPFLVALLALTGLGATAYTYEGEPMREPDHFKLIEPTSWLIESENRGDPQKSAPCGGTNTDYGKESYVVNEAKGGSMMHLKLQEMVYHPGHYRVALAVNSPTELPRDPIAVTRQDTVARTGQVRVMSVSAPIQNPAVAPVLADGLFQHTAAPAAGTFFEADVQLPNINCSHCTVQIIQFMAEHADNNPGGFSYHHCAFFKITADPSKPLDTRWPAERTGAAQ
jgi:hypothetical protein